MISVQSFLIFESSQCLIHLHKSNPMKKVPSILLISGFLLFAGSLLLYPMLKDTNPSQINQTSVAEAKKMPSPMQLPFLAELQWMKLRDPQTGEIPSCLVQDSRPGHRTTWYYGTGELLSTTKRNISTNVRTIGIGNGIFKSTDNGATWVNLPYTQGGSPSTLSEVFQGVWRVVTDPVAVDKDIVYAACYGAIMRSENGGDTWEMVLYGYG